MESISLESLKDEILNSLLSPPFIPRLVRLEADTFAKFIERDTTIAGRDPLLSNVASAIDEGVRGPL